MSKKDLIEAVAVKTEMTREKAGIAVDAVIAHIEDSMKKGEEVRIPGFGTFKVAQRAERTGQRRPEAGDLVARDEIVLGPHQGTQRQTGKVRVGVEVLRRPDRGLGMPCRIDRLEILQQGLGRVTHPDPGHPLVIPGSLHRAESPECPQETAGHVSTATMSPMPVPTCVIMPGQPPMMPSITSL